MDNKQLKTSFMFEELPEKTIEEITEQIRSENRSRMEINKNK